VRYGEVAVHVSAVLCCIAVRCVAVHNAGSLLAGPFGLPCLCVLCPSTQTSLPLSTSPNLPPLPLAPSSIPPLPPDGVACLAGTPAQGAQLCAGWGPQPAAPAGDLQGGRGGGHGGEPVQAAVRGAPTGGNPRSSACACERVHVASPLAHVFTRCCHFAKASLCGSPRAFLTATSLPTPAVPSPDCCFCPPRPLCHCVPPRRLQAVVSLPVQYRMAADIMLLSNTLIYNNALRCGSGGWAGCAAGVVSGSWVS